MSDAGIITLRMLSRITFFHPSGCFMRAHTWCYEVPLLFIGLIACTFALKVTVAKWSLFPSLPPPPLLPPSQRLPPQVQNLETGGIMVEVRARAFIYFVPPITFSWL